MLCSFRILANALFKASSLSQDIMVSIQRKSDAPAMMLPFNLISRRFSWDNRTAYRPTNEDCLMRLVTTPNFCSACLEGLWHALLAKVRLIDSLEYVPAASGCGSLGLELVAIGQLRNRREPISAKESYSIRWSRIDEELKEYENQTTIPAIGGSYTVQVQYHSEEVIVDPYGRLHDEESYIVDCR